MNIEVTNLTKKFPDFSLKDVFINVPKGSIVGLIGENGAGKTTLIKCILNVMHKDSGTIKLFDKDYSDSLKEDIGVVFDDSFINESYNIKDLNLIMSYIYKKWDTKLFFKYMKDYKIPLKKPIKKLSTGMKKKIEIATALSHHPKLLILDEPTSGLDPIIRSEILDMFQNFVSNSENSILLSTHITSDLEHIADDVIFISNGEIIFASKLEEIKNTYIMLEMSKEDFSKYDKKKIIRYKENRLDCLVLIDKKDKTKSDEAFIKHYTSLDDIMLMYIRGVKCED